MDLQLVTVAMLVLLTLAVAWAAVEIRRLHDEIEPLTSSSLAAAIGSV